MADELPALTNAQFPYKWEDENGTLGPYDLRMLTFREIALFNRVVERHAITPIESVARILPQLPDPERAELWQKAKEQTAVWDTPSITELEGRATILRTDAARTDFVTATLRWAKPDISEDEIERVLKVNNKHDAANLYSILVGVPVDPDAGDPKADAGADPARVIEGESDEERTTRIAKEEESRLLRAFLLESLARSKSVFAWITQRFSTMSSKSSEKPRNKPPT